MHFIYVILPALSLLNMGVEGATIAGASTSKHSNELHQARKVVYDRQFHNADFGSGSTTSGDERGPVSQATKHAARGSSVHDITSDDLSTTVTDKNGSGLNLKPDSYYVDIIRSLSEDVMNYLEKLVSMSAPLDGVFSLEDNSVIPQRLGRRFLREAREDGSLEGDLEGKPLHSQAVPDPLGALFDSRDLNLLLPIPLSRDIDPSPVFLERQTDIGDIDIKALRNSTAQNEDIKLD